MGNITQISQIEKYYNEYFETIVNYQNITRHSLFCLYLNISNNNSTYNSTNSTYTKHYSGVRYDSYDFTPIQSIDPIANITQLDNNITGYKFIGESRIVTYTVKTPQIGDLICFPYTSTDQYEIYRVKEISVPLNSRNDNKHYFFQLAIEYAPIKTLENIKIINNFVYLVNDNCYLMKQDYIEFLNDISELESALKSYFFHNKSELYYFTYNNLNIASLDENFIIYEFFKKYRSYFTFQFNIPFGILNFNNYSNLLINLDSNEVIHKNEINLNLDLSKINLINKILNYEQRRY